MYRLSYYPWITQNITPAALDGQIKLFAGYVEEELRKLGSSESKVQVLPPLDVPLQIDQLCTDQVEIALMNPLGFVFARQRTAKVEAAAVALRIVDGKVGRFYFAQLYTSKKTAIRSLDSISGRTLGYGVPFSTSNFLVPAAMLVQAGVHPFVRWSSVAFLGGHDLVAKAVYNGQVDVGAGHDGAISDLANQPGYGDASDILLRLARSEPIPSDPVVLNVSDANKRKQLQSAIINAGNSDAGKAALKIFWGDTRGLEPTTSAEYDMLVAKLKLVGVTEKDLLPS